MPSIRRAATKVVVFQWPCGIAARSRWPFGARPRMRAMFVAAQVLWQPKSCGSPSLVDEHQARRIEVELPLEPRLAPPQDIRPILLCGVRCLFLSVILRRAKKRQSVPMPTPMSRAASAPGSREE